MHARPPICEKYASYAYTMLTMLTMLTLCLHYAYTMLTHSTLSLPSNCVIACLLTAEHQRVLHGLPLCHGSIESAPCSHLSLGPLQDAELITYT